jgi:hypothetical protein
MKDIKRHEKVESAINCFEGELSNKFVTVSHWDVGIGVTGEGFDKNVSDGFLFIRVAGKLKPGTKVHSADSPTPYIAE